MRSETSFLRKLYSFGIGLGLVGIGFSLGIVASLLSVRWTTYVDLRSGAERQTIHLGPFLVRDQDFDLGHTVFEAFPMEDGQYGLPGKPCWVKAFSYRDNSRRSPNTTGAQLENKMAKIASFFPLIGKERAAKIKGQLLRTIADNGTSAGWELAMKIYGDLIDEDLARWQFHTGQGNSKHRPQGKPPATRQGNGHSTRPVR